MISVDKIAKVIDGNIYGDATFSIQGICNIENGKENCITYLGSDKYKKYLNKNTASVIIVDDSFKIDSNKIYIKVQNPILSFIKVMNLFSKKNNFKYTISKQAFLHSKVQVGKKVYIGSNVTIEKNVSIGNNVKIYPGSYIGEDSVIGDNTIIYSNVSIYNDCIIGKNCKIDSGTIIGSDGFGLAKDKHVNISVPHIGKVIIKDDVSIGANCCIDRGTIENTIINNNCRLDNLIQIAHNVKIGKGCIIAAQVGIAGSSILENYVTIAGQVGIIDHIIIRENSIITAKSLVCSSTQKKSFLTGNPAQPHREFLRQKLILKNLDKKNN